MGRSLFSLDKFRQYSGQGNDQQDKKEYFGERNRGSIQTDAPMIVNNREGRYY